MSNAEREWEAWYRAYKDKLLVEITQLDTVAKMFEKNEPTKPIADLILWVKVCLRHVGEILGIQDTHYREAIQGAQFHATLSKRIETLNGLVEPLIQTVKKIETSQAELQSLKTLINQRDEETKKTLQLILDWKRESQETLDRAKEYFSGLVGQHGGSTNDRRQAPR